MSVILIEVGSITKEKLVRPSITVLKVFLFFGVIFFGAISCKKDPTPKNLQKQIVGSWMGTYQTGVVSGLVEFTFEEDGHYSAAIVSGPYASVFSNSADEVDHEQKRFVIFFVDGLGKAHGEATYVSESDGLLISTSFRDLEISEDDGLEVLSFNGGGAIIELTRK